MKDTQPKSQNLPKTFEYINKKFWMALAIILVAFVFTLLLIRVEYSEKKSVQLDGQVYYYYGPLDVKGNCVSFLDAESNNYRTICTTTSVTINK